MIGGPFCQSPLEPGLISSAGQTLTPRERNALWKLFQAIGRVWEDLHPTATDSSNLKSSWLDFIDAKTNSEPSYIAEYSNAVLCVDELMQEIDDDLNDIETETARLEVYRRLFLENGIPPGPPSTRLAHAKKYVIDEFIRVNVVASGFKSFGPAGAKGKNYRGYMGGSRYNIHARVRNYEPESEEAK